MQGLDRSMNKPVVETGRIPTQSGVLTAQCQRTQGDKPTCNEKQKTVHTLKKISSFTEKKKALTTSVLLFFFQMYRIWSSNNSSFKKHKRVKRDKESGDRESE